MDSQNARVYLTYFYKAFNEGFGSSSLTLATFSSSFAALSFSTASSAESLDHLLEELKLLVLLVGYDGGISIIWEVSLPLDKCAIAESDFVESDQTVDASGSVSWLCWKDFIADWVTDITDLIDSDLPAGSISIVNLNHWFKLPWSTINEWCSCDLCCQNFLQFEALENSPGLVSWNRKDAALSLM